MATRKTTKSTTGTRTRSAGKPVERTVRRATAVKKPAKPTKKIVGPGSGPSRRAKGSGAAKNAATRKANAPYPRESGPRKWVLPTMEAGYARLAPRDQFDATERGMPGSGTRMARSALRPDGAAAPLAQVADSLWLERLAEYKQRKVGAVREAAMRGAALAPGAVVPGAKNWSFLGPSVVMNGQAWGDPPVGGRVGGIAIAPGGQRVYAASANGGVFRSDDGGVTWRSLMDAFDLDPTSSSATTVGIFALTFAGATLFYVGTTDGEVVRFSSTGGNWTQSRIDNVAAGALPLRGIVADIAVDWSDASGKSIYIAFGGMGDYRHVWRFDGTRWAARSGPSAGTAKLLDVEHNALIVDRANPSHVYVGADIGVWHSADGGANWEPLPNGLPDAPVFDLQIHPTQRLLRATTHGRGLYEYALD